MRVEFENNSLEVTFVNIRAAFKGKVQHWLFLEEKMVLQLW